VGEKVPVKILTVFLVFATFSSVAITWLYYRIFSNFRDHGKLSSRLLFLDDRVPKAFMLLTAVSAMFVAVTGLIGATGIAGLEILSQRSLLYIFISSQALNLIATLIWQKVLLKASTRHSSR
jgi:hypothetical protein